MKKFAKRVDLNPSAADRWTTCTASAKFILDNWHLIPPENKTYSDDGNTAHEVAAALLQNRKPDKKKCPTPISAEMNWHGWNYMEFVESLVKPDGRLLADQKLPLFYCESRNAIIDAAVVNKDSLHIVDYKYGEGIIVSPEENNQAVIYAKTLVWGYARLSKSHYSAFLPPDDFPVSITIYQPRTRGDFPFHTWHTTWGDIHQRARKVFDIAVNILHVTDPISPKAYNLQFAPSEKACQWCPAKGFCEERKQLFTRDLQMLEVIDDSPKPMGKVLTEEQLAAVLQHGDEIKKWIGDVQKFALAHMKAGHKIPGFKLVLSRGGNRAWKDPDKVVKYLVADTILRREELVVEEVISPAAVEKLLGKKKLPQRVYDQVSKSDGHPIIAPVTDPRAECFVDARFEFENLDGEDSETNLEDF